MKERAIEVLKIEADAILKLIDRVDDQFDNLVDLICRSKGRLIISGIGKSGIIAKKIIATLNSTGTRSLFLHPVEALHGDLGVVGEDDIFLALSNSGETDELNMVIPSVRKIGCTIVAFTGNRQSSLAQQSDLIIDVGVDHEACPLGLAPTASTTAMLAMGDALAVVLIEKKNFKSSDFKKFHPAGALGQRLASYVKEFMSTDDALPMVYEGATMAEAVEEMNRGGLGTTLVLNPDDVLTGIVTDGDIRRLVSKQLPFFDMKVEAVMTANPRRIKAHSPTYDALNIMEQFQITVLPIVNDDDRVVGILHLHDILGKGEFKFKADHPNNHI